MRCRLLTAVIAVLPLGVAAAPAPSPGLLVLEPCHLSVPQVPMRIAAKCTELEVAEDPDAPDGRRITLEIAVLPATTRDRAADPLFFVTGGPGQSALDSFVTVSAAFSRINRARDVVLVDQRGTGGSNPLQCGTSGLDDLDASADERRAWLADCLAGLPGDPRFYTTSVAIRDLDAVRTALGCNY